MSRNAMNACIDAANERDERRETAQREWAESARPLGIVERLRNCGQSDLADMAQEMLTALQQLVEAAERSDDSCYGTLGTSFVRFIANPAIAKAEGKA